MMVGLEEAEEEDTGSLECLVCSSSERRVIFGPCGHVCVCEGCAGRVKKCLLCKVPLSSRRLIEECLVCSERRADILFRPCAHLIACSRSLSILHPLPLPHSTLTHCSI